MTRTRAKLSAWLDLSALTNMPAKPRDVLVVNMCDVIDAERANLATGSVASAAWSPPTRSATRSTAGAIALAALALRSTESRARASIAAFTSASWSSGAAETCALRPTFT